jgi:PIN domain nuclease of toxin-antitoxin system
LKLLLDTHILLWWLDNAAQLRDTAREIIADPENLVSVSAASIWEIRIKASLGKLSIPTTFNDYWLSNRLKSCPPLGITPTRLRNFRITTATLLTVC